MFLRRRQQVDVSSGEAATPAVLLLAISGLGAFTEGVVDFCRSEWTTADVFCVGHWHSQWHRRRHGPKRRPFHYKCRSPGASLTPFHASSSSTASTTTTAITTISLQQSLHTESLRVVGQHESRESRPPKSI